MPLIDRKYEQRYWREVLAGIVLLAVGLGGVRLSYAQSAPQTEVRYTFVLVGVSLTDALERLLDETQLSLVYESELVAGRTTFCRAERVPAETLLRCILRDTGLDFVRLSSGTYVLVADPRATPRYASLTGQVLDAETGAPLPDASVLLAGNSTGTATNRDGRFAFTALQPGPYRLTVTHVAYLAATDTVYVGPDAHRRLDVPLQPRIILSAPVVVNGFEIRRPSESLGTGRASVEALSNVAGVGAQDVVQNLEAIVGVRLGDALSDVHVQGGASNEQQFLLDGVPVFMPVPGGGFIGPFSPFALGQVTVQKAGFGAAHGSELSGVIEVEHRLGGRDQDLTAQVDPLSLNARWSGQAALAPQVEVQWMMAGRKGLWDTYAPPRLETLFRQWATPDPFLIDALDSTEALPDPGELPGASLEVSFDDLHAAARLRLGGLRSVYASFYRGAGTFGVGDVLVAGAEDNEDLYEDAYRWHNRTAQLRYEWVQSRRLFLNLGLWTTDYALTHPISQSAAPQSAPTVSSDEFNEIAEYGLRLGGDLTASARHAVSAALEAVYTESAFVLSLDPFGASPAGPATVRPITWWLAGFVEDRFALGPRTTLTLGTRLTYLLQQRTVYAEPRLAVRYDGEAGRRGTWAVRGAVGRYRQYLHAFDVATYNVTSLVPHVRFWLPVGRDQRPPEAYHATAAFLYEPGPAWEFGLETYYKHQPHLLVLDYGNQAPTPKDVLRSADGYAYGAALTATREGRRLQMDAQYEYAVARRRIANRFDGAFVPVPWNAPHRLYLALDVLPLPHWTATVRWQGVFGRSWGFRQAYYDFLEPDPHTPSFSPFDLSEPARHRLPAFSQWDAGLAYARVIRGVGVQGRVSLINVLGRRNVTDWSLRHDEQAGEYVRQARHAASFIPSFSLRLSL